MVEIKDIWSILEHVYDPEIPVLSICDLGVVRDVKLKANEQLEVIITPTYSGCPAMGTFEESIKDALAQRGFPDAIVTTVLSPPWTSDWLTRSGRKKLKAYGIAPPVESTPDINALFQDEKKIECPRCDSISTQLVSQFGSTACKALYQCKDCLEPFDYFKCH